MKFADRSDHCLHLEALDPRVARILDGRRDALLEVELDALVIGREGRDVDLQLAIEQRRLDADFPSLAFSSSKSGANGSGFDRRVVQPPVL